MRLYNKAIVSGYQIIFPVFLFAMSFQERASVPWQFFNESFHPEQIARTESRFVNFQDTIPNDTIHVCFSGENMLIAFYREIQSGVCLEGVCLPVHLYIYWTASGNYLGYRLGKGEILTKNEHEPFTAADYKKLHVLLGDPQSLLGDYTAQEMTRGKSTDTVQADGISGATLSDIRGYIVKGAAYTTHTLWNITYGANRDSILDISSRYVSVPLLSRMFESRNIQDKVWALDNINFLGTKLPEIIPQVQELIRKDNFYVKRKALSSLTSSALSDSLIQSMLFETFEAGDFGVKRLIVEYLSSYRSLSPAVINEFIQQLPDEGDAVVMLVFNLFKKGDAMDSKAIHEISKLLTHEREPLARAAFSYLKSLSMKAVWLEEQLKKYEEKF